MCYGGYVVNRDEQLLPTKKIVFQSFDEIYRSFINASDHSITILFDAFSKTVHKLLDLSQVKFLCTLITPNGKSVLWKNYINNGR